MLLFFLSFLFNVALCVGSTKYLRVDGNTTINVGNMISVVVISLVPIFMILYFIIWFFSDEASVWTKVKDKPLF